MEIEAVSRGERIPSSGRGTMLMRSRRACTFLFGDRAVTVTNKNGVVSPSSVVADCIELPSSRSAMIVEGVLSTESYSIVLGRPTRLILSKGPRPDVRSCLSSIAPFLKRKRMSISVALPMNQGKAKKPPGLEGWMSVRQAKVLRESSDLLHFAEGLLGLGYGLTPSGDDFIEGMVLVNEVLGSSSREIRPQIEMYENVFSKTMLLDALDGHYAMPVKRFGDALRGRWDVRSAALALSSYGSTSGTDVLAGVWYALDREANRMDREEHQSLRAHS